MLHTFYGRQKRRPFLGLLLLFIFFRPSAARSCQGERWGRLHEALLEASQEEYLENFSPAMFELTQYEIFEWFKANYRDCVEGLLSMVLYLSLIMDERRASLLDLASRAARELNPLALRSGQSTWPFFGLLEQLQLGVRCKAGVAGWAARSSAVDGSLAPASILSKGTVCAAPLSEREGELGRPCCRLGLDRSFTRRRFCQPFCLKIGSELASWFPVDRCWSFRWN